MYTLDNLQVVLLCNLSIIMVSGLSHFFNRQFCHFVKKYFVLWCIAFRYIVSRCSVLALSHFDISPTVIPPYDMVFSTPCHGLRPCATSPPTPQLFTHQNHRKNHNNPSIQNFEIKRNSNPCSAQEPKNLRLWISLQTEDFKTFYIGNEINIIRIKNNTWQIGWFMLYYL